MSYTRIGILGGTGFVGRHLAAQLQQQGYQVRILTRSREAHRELLVLPTLDLVETDVHDPKKLEAALRGCHAVINLVGILNEKGHRGAGFRDAHVELTRKALKACRANGIERYLHMSALTADHPEARSYYLKTKFDAEKRVQDAAKQGLRTTIFAPSVIFGPEDNFINQFAALTRWMPGLFPLACADAKFKPVYVGDVAKAFTQCLPDVHSFGKRYELCGPAVISLRELIHYIASLQGRRVKVLGLPDWLARLQAAILEYVPGKPFSKDNYESLQLDNVCREDGLGELGIHATGMDAVVPVYLQHLTTRARLDHYRRELAGHQERGRPRPHP